MINIYFKDIKSERAKYCFLVSDLFREVVHVVENIENGSSVESHELEAKALHLIARLESLRRGNVPIQDVNEFAEQASSAIRLLANKRASLGAASNEDQRELQQLAASAISHADRLCDCLVGITKAVDRAILEKVDETLRAGALLQEEDNKKRGFFSRLWFGK